MPPDLDKWLPEPSLRIAHRRASSAPADRLWACAREVRLRDTARLGRLIRWRIPGTSGEMSFDTLFREPPFLVLEESGGKALVSGLVGRIWTLQRDYPKLHDPEEFLQWSARGTARVVFANWVQATDSGGAELASETRVGAIGRRGRLGVAAVRPLVSTFQHLVGSEGIEAAVRLAERE